MLGEPVTVIPPALGLSCKIECVAEGLSRGGPFDDGREIENREPDRPQLPPRTIEYSFTIICTGGDDMAPTTGTIKRLVSDKGFGFILAGDRNECYFEELDALSSL